MNVTIVRPEFNQEKVEKLNATLLETVAKYGHRLEHLPEDERVIVIVESGLYDYAWGQDYVQWQGTPTSIGLSKRSTARHQIAVRKQDLTAATTAEALAGKIEETEY